MLDALWWMWTSDRKIYTLCRSCHVQLHASSLDFHLSALYFLIIKSRELHSLISGHFYIKWMISCMIHSLPVGRIFSAHYLRNIFFLFCLKEKDRQEERFFIHCSLSKCQGLAKSERSELNPGLPSVWLEPKFLSHHLPSLRMCISKKLGKKQRS